MTESFEKTWENKIPRWQEQQQAWRDRVDAYKNRREAFLAEVLPVYITSIDKQAQQDKAAGRELTTHETTCHISDYPLFRDLNFALLDYYGQFDAYQPSLHISDNHAFDTVQAQTKQPNSFEFTFNLAWENV